MQDLSEIACPKCHWSLVPVREDLGAYKCTRCGATFALRRLRPRYRHVSLRGCLPRRSRGLAFSPSWRGQWSRRQLPYFRFSTESSGFKASTARALPTCFWVGFLGRAGYGSGPAQFLSSQRFAGGRVDRAWRRSVPRGTLCATTLLINIAMVVGALFFFASAMPRW